MDAIASSANKLFTDATQDVTDGKEFELLDLDEDQGSGRFYLLNLNYTNPISHIFATYCLFVFTAVILSVFSLAFIGIMNRFLVGIENAKPLTKRSVDLEGHAENIIRLLHEMDESLRRMGGGGSGVQDQQRLWMICQAVKESTGFRSPFRKTSDEVDNLLRLLDHSRNILEDGRLTGEDGSGAWRDLSAVVSAGHLGASGRGCIGDDEGHLLNR